MIIMEEAIENRGVEYFKNLILSRISIDSNGCWNMGGAPNKGKYRQFNVRIIGTPIHKMVMVHRMSYRVYVGPIEDGLTIDHLCENGACVNPDHLEVVTRKENSQRWFKNHPKEVCAHGHPLVGDNLRISILSGGHTRRLCRTCKNERRRRHYHETYVPTGRPIGRPKKSH